MKRIISTFFLLSLVVAFLSCEKGQFDEVASSQPSTVVVDDDEPTNPSDDSEKSDDSDNSDNSDNSDDSDNSDSSDGSDSSGDDGEDDTSLDDRTTPYEEPYTGGDDADEGDNNDSTHGRSEDDALTVVEFLSASTSKGFFVNGYIIGTCKQNISNADFDPPFTYSSALLLADTPNERDFNKIMSLELKSGSNIREALDLTKHPELYQQKLQVFGYVTTYLGIKGMKGVSTWHYGW